MSADLPDGNAPFASEVPIQDLIDAAKYARDYLSPAPPDEGKPWKAFFALSAAIRRAERSRQENT